MDFFQETIISEAFAHLLNLQCIVWGCGWAWGRDFLQRELSFHLADLQNRREYLYDKAKNRDFCLLIAAWLMQIPSKTSHIFIKRHFGPWSNYRVRCIQKAAYYKLTIDNFDFGYHRTYHNLNWRICCHLQEYFCLPDITK